MSYESLLFAHLAGAFLFVSGAVAAAVVRLAAMGRTRPSEIAVLLRAARLAIPVIAAGLVLVVGFGFWLASRLDLDLGSAWLSATFVIVAAVLLVGSVSGRQDRHTRELAERLARDDDRSSPELERRLRDPLNLALNASLLAATVAILALMVWKP